MNTANFKSVIPIGCIVLLLLLLQSCGGPIVVAPEPTYIADTLTVAPYAITRCPPLTPAEFPHPKKPKVVYALIDKSGSYRSYTRQARDYLIQELVNVLEPGDRVYLVWLGASETQAKYYFAEGVPDVAFPQFNTPIPTLTATITPTITKLVIPSVTPTGNSQLNDQKTNLTATALAVQKTATTSAKQIIATNTEIAVEKDINNTYCEQLINNQSNENVYKEWNIQRRIAVENFIEKTMRPLLEVAPESNDNGTHIYNSLFYASRTFLQIKETNTYEGYYLIILSDMEDVGSEEGEMLDVRLEGVHVLIAMATCDQSIECQDRAIYWTNYLSDQGAILPPVPYRLIDETIPFVIRDFINSGGQR